MFDERRRQKRVDVNIPIRVNWADGQGNRCEEVTRSMNVRADGAIVVLKQQLKMGTVLELSLPLPSGCKRVCRQDGLRSNGIGYPCGTYAGPCRLQNSSTLSGLRQQTVSSRVLTTFQLHHQ